MSPSAGARSHEFEAMFIATRARVLAYLLRRATGSEEAGDLLSETYLIAWRKLDQVPRERAQQLPWLLAVARNLLRRSYEQAQHRDQATQALIGELHAMSPVDAVPAREIDPELAAALSRLKERDREILELASWEELTPREIASVLKITANTVRIRLHRTRKRLARELKPEPDAAADPHRPLAAGHARPTDHARPG